MKRVFSSIVFLPLNHGILILNQLDKVNYVIPYLLRNLGLDSRLRGNDMFSNVSLLKQIGISLL